MSNFSNVGDNPNDKMPPGKPLGHDELAGQDDDVEGGTDPDGLDTDDETSDKDRENQAGSENMNAEKFNRLE